MFQAKATLNLLTSVDNSNKKEKKKNVKDQALHLLITLLLDKSYQALHLLITLLLNQSYQALHLLFDFDLQQVVFSYLLFDLLVAQQVLS